MTDLESRLVNWGDCWRYRLGLDRTQAGSAEGNHRNRWRHSWDCDPTVGCAPVAPRALDHRDADEIELAVCSIDLFNHVLLKTWYIRRFDAEGTLRKASRAARWPVISYPTLEAAERECSRRIAYAQDRVAAQLQVPAVIRKQRATAIVRDFLGLTPLTAVISAE